MSREIDRDHSDQRIAELHADAEQFQQLGMSKRRRQRRSLGRLGRLLWPTGVASRANHVLGELLSPPWPSRRDALGPSRLNPSLGR
ncbi:MAG TPA: hypothetical protein VGS14_07855 [Actinomycetes bacterium]|jgi:hypothetical protein|nr:hypothetical protein [Actinomycetes bacterium]